MRRKLSIHILKSLLPCALLLFHPLLSLSQDRTQLRADFQRALLRQPDTVKMVVIGDVMMHSRQMLYPMETFLEDLSPLLRGADISLANMEFSLGGKPYSGYPAFSAPDHYASYVRDSLGVDVFLTANNHILDRGSKGLERTLGIYDSLQVRHCGSYRSKEEKDATFPLIISAKGIRIALINFTYGTNAAQSGEYPGVCRMDEVQVKAAIQRAKDRGADFIVALPHWGTEYSLTHSNTQQQWARMLISQGCDAVIGSHPHVVQDTTHIDSRSVIYSLGNAVSNMSAPNTRLGLAVELCFIKDSFLGDKSVSEPQLHFLWCTLPGKLCDSYKAIEIKKWASRKGDWLDKSDYLNMIQTLERVCAATGIEYYCPL